MGKSWNQHGSPRMPRDGAKRGVGRQGISPLESQPSGRDDSADAKAQRSEQLWRENMALVQSQGLTLRIISCALVVELIGLSDGRTVEHIGSIEGVLVTEFLINSGRPVVLGSDFLSRKGVNPRIP